MRVKLEFGTGGPAVGIIGTWDPLAETHREIFRKLVRHTRRRHLGSAVIILDPVPARFLFPSEPWPQYDDVQARIAMMRDCGIETVVLTRFARRDVDASARDFFRSIAAQVTLRELWLGASQSLGRGIAGSPRAIAAIGRQRRFTIRHLPVAPRASTIVRESLLCGRVREAIGIVGRAPVWQRPRSAVLRLEWMPGEYLAVPLDGPLAEPRRRDAVRTRLSRAQDLRWPFGTTRWMAFLAGPADLLR